MMDRRVFIGTLAGALLTAPLTAGAEQAGRVWRVGLLFPSGQQRGDRAWRSFVQGLRNFGYVEGRNVTFVYGTESVRAASAMSDFARALTRQNIDLIVTSGASGARAAHEATRTTPIVMLAVFDAERSGLVASLARPGGNITGISLPYRDMAAKRLELLKAALPKLTRAAFLTTGSLGAEVDAARVMEAAADPLGLKLTTYEINVGRPRDLDRAFAGMRTARVEAVAVSEASELLAEVDRIARLTLIHRLPSIGTRRLVENGGLMSYGASLPHIYRRAATYVDKILKGAKPADLPVEQPTAFELVINLKTSKALRLGISQSLLQRADEVIE